MSPGSRPSGIPHRPARVTPTPAATSTSPKIISILPRGIITVCASSPPSSPSSPSAPNRPTTFSPATSSSSSSRSIPPIPPAIIPVPLKPWPPASAPPDSPSHQHQPQNNQRSTKRHNHSMRFLAALLAIFPLCAQSPDHIRARDIFQQLIEINTTDSSGDNTRAAEAMAARFRAAGFPQGDIQVLAPVARKGNLVVRLHGTGASRPILFLGHLDVVEARRADWPFDPFVFLQQDGYFYGRGTSDMRS